MREFYATCAQGFEPYLAGELRSLGVAQVRPLTGGVSFTGELKDAYRVCLWSRLASRVLMIIARLSAQDADDLYASASAVEWEQHLSVDQTFAIHARGTSDQLKNTQFTAVKVKDALVDRMRKLAQARPNVDTHNPDVRFTVALRGTKATLSLDLTGEPLHKRGYRTDKKQTEAPLKETLAACVLAAAQWYRTCKTDEGLVVVDPCCGSGTLVIEAALQALDRAPGLVRPSWGFESYLHHDEQAWSELLDEADERCEQAQNRSLICIAADKEAAALKLAQENIHRAGLDRYVTVLHTDVAELARRKTLFECDDLPQNYRSILVTNPPYAYRMGFDAQLPALYSSLASLANHPDLSQATLSFITPDETLDDFLQRSPDTVVSVKNGPLDSSIRVFLPHTVQNGASSEVADKTGHDPDTTDKASQYKSPDQSRSDNSSDQQVNQRAQQTERTPYLVPSSDQFAARFAKVLKLRKKWAKKNGISAFRVYDADLPDYAAAIDWYQGVGADENEVYIHLAEYQAPKHIDQSLAQKRLYDMLTIIPAICEIPSDHVVCKVRKRAKGGSQYQRATTGSHQSDRSRFVTQEGGLAFEVDMGTYLDTGLFLDHRITRSLVKEHASGARFLNLFAYTGSATCYASAGGAVSTTTVDLSKTYLAWAEQNMRLNGFTGKQHRFIYDDALGFLLGEKRRGHRYDLVFCDPPTFSNSSKMQASSFDVQRDHVELLKRIAAVLSPTGTIIFSCNLRSFVLDEEALEASGLVARNITSQTIPEDFSRNPRIHSCFILNHR